MCLGKPFRNQHFFLVYIEPWELWFSLVCVRNMLPSLCKSSPWLWSCCPRTLLPCCWYSHCYSRKAAVLVALGMCHFSVPYLFLIWLFIGFDVLVSTSSSNTAQGCLSWKALFSQALTVLPCFAQELLCVWNFHIYKTCIWAEKPLWINAVLLWANYLMF